MQLNISEFRKRNTYESIAEEIANPREKIALPGISIAKQFKDTNQGSRFDDDNFFGLEKDNINKMKEQQQQLQLQNMANSINSLSVNQIAATNPVVKSHTSVQPSTNAAIAAIEDITSANTEFLDTTSGQRDKDEQNELEEAIDASNASEALRKANIDKLLKNVGKVESSDPTYIEKLIKETGGASSSGATADVVNKEVKPKAKKLNNPDMEEPVGEPTIFKPKPRSVSREPNAKSKAKEIAKDKAEAKKR